LIGDCRRYGEAASRDGVELPINHLTVSIPPLPARRLYGGLQPPTDD
jgi:hypothetical protein